MVSLYKARLNSSWGETSRRVDLCWVSLGSSEGDITETMSNVYMELCCEKSRWSFSRELFSQKSFIADVLQRSTYGPEFDA